MPDSDHSDFQSDPDVQLMLEAASGSEVAFAELIRRHQNGLVNFFVRMGYDQTILLHDQAVTGHSLFDCRHAGR